MDEFMSLGLLIKLASCYWGHQWGTERINIVWIRLLFNASDGDTSVADGSWRGTCVAASDTLPARQRERPAEEDAGTVQQRTIRPTQR